MAIAPQGKISASSTPGSNQNYKTALYSLMVLFFMMGFITCLNDILVPYLKKMFDLSYTQASMIQFCFFGAYAVMSIPSSMIVEAAGYKRGMILGFIGAAMGCLLFFPAVTLHSYLVFLIALFILATGVVLLQVAANPYVSVLGPPETASARLTLNQALNSVGTFLAPFFGIYFILSALNKAGSTEAVKIPYLIIAVVLLVIAFILSRMTLPEIVSNEGEDTTVSDAVHKSAWSYKHLVLGAIGIFAYVGAEVSIGSYMVNYLEMKDVAGLAPEIAAKYVAFYWGGAMVGRFLGAYILNIFKPGYVLAVNAALAILLILLSINTTGAVAMYSIILVGLCNSIMFPTIFTLAVHGLGKHTKQGSGILSTAIVGGAIIPVIQASLADSPGIGLRIAFIVPAVCYLYIVWFGAKGHEAKDV
ncbi:MAG TPA: sugar MFS transporter [Cytophagaceae bacterium]|nr:sugar MFS transporter [Cytophagaceae bacterium]